MGKEQDRRRYYIQCQLVGDVRFFVGAFSTEQSARDHVASIRQFSNTLIFWEGHGMQPGAVVCYGVIGATAAKLIGQMPSNTLSVMPKDAAMAREQLNSLRKSIANAAAAYEQLTLVGEDDNA